MGFIDADAHGVETNRQTWSHFDPKEKEYAPPESGPWMFDGGVRSLGSLEERIEGEKVRGVDKQTLSFYPSGARDLSNVPVRLKHMDELGVDVQVLFSSFWLIDPVQDPVREAAMARSYNRWAAMGCAPSKGRLRWMIKVPGRIMERAFEELEFGAKNGAAGSELTGYKYNIAPGHPYWYPLYERCQDLGLCVAFHIGASQQDYAPNPRDTHYRTIGRVPGAYASLIAYDVPHRFPKLQFSFCEAGSTWAAAQLQQCFRGKTDATERYAGNDWRKLAKNYLAETGNMNVACYMDDDIEYSAQICGDDRLMLGTDYTHFDVGSDPDGLRIVARRSDLRKELRVKMLDINPRKCYGIPLDFKPADAHKSAELALAGR